MIKVYPECAPLSSERVVEIKGQPEVVVNTVYSLLEFLQTVSCQRRRRDDALSFKK